MQRDEEFLECIVSFMGVYHRSLPEKVSHRRRVSVDIMGSRDRATGPRPPTAGLGHI